MQASCPSVQCKEEAYRPPVSQCQQLVAATSLPNLLLVSLHHLLSPGVDLLVAGFGDAAAAGCPVSLT